MSSLGKKNNTTWFASICFPVIITVRHLSSLPEEMMSKKLQLRQAVSHILRNKLILDTILWKTDFLKSFFGSLTVSLCSFHQLLQFLSVHTPNDISGGRWRPRCQSFTGSRTKWRHGFIFLHDSNVCVRARIYFNRFNILSVFSFCCVLIFRWVPEVKTWIYHRYFEDKLKLRWTGAAQRATVTFGGSGAIV